MTVEVKEGNIKPYILLSLMKTIPKMLFKLILSIYFTSRVTQTARERDRDIFHLLVYSYNGYNGLPEARSPELHSDLPHKWQDPSIRAILCCFPGK